MDGGHTEDAKTVRRIVPTLSKKYKIRAISVEIILIECQFSHFGIIISIQGRRKSGAGGAIAPQILDI